MSAHQRRIEARAARASMLANAEALKARLSPALLVNDAVDGARDKALTVAAHTVETARARPALAGSVAGGLLLLLARKPLFGLLDRLRGKRTPDPLDSNDPAIDQIEGHPS